MEVIISHHVWFYELQSESRTATVTVIVISQIPLYLNKLKSAVWDEHFCGHEK